MPYSGPSDSTLPDYVKKLSAKDKRQWVAVFNSAYQSCQDEGGKDCESSAFAQANGVVMKRRAHTGIMIAFYISQDIAHQLTIEGGEAPEEMHITLAYLGDSTDFQVSSDEVSDIIRAFALKVSPIIGNIQGIARFIGVEDGNKDAFVALFDSPELPQFRQKLVDSLGELFSNQTHGFVPHITLAYLDHEAELPSIELPRDKITFDRITLKWGDERREFDLSGGRRMDINELWDKIRALFEPLIERIKDVASWDGSASRYGSTEAYCRACLINMNTGPAADWTQAKCKLPIKDTDGQPVRQAIHAAAAALGGARGGVDAPPDEKKKAANKIISYYNQMDEQAPASVYKAAGKTPPQRSTAYLPTQTRALTITRVADGQARWLVIAASAVVNRVGAIDSTVLFDNFIRRASESGEYPALDFLHEGEQLRFGPADWLKRDGALYLASGTFDDTDIARAAQAGLEKEPDYWGASIAYHPMSEPLRLVAEGDIPVYTDGINNYISIVPKRMAANLFTAASVTEEVMRMDQRAYEELVKLVGEEAAKPFAAMVDEANRMITKTGMVVRADEPKAEMPPATPAAPAAPAEPPEVEPASVPATPVTERADEPWKSALDALTERVAQIEKALKDGDESKRSSEERAVKELDHIKSDLASVMDSKSRWDQWLNDLPESIKAETESVYRARNQSPAPMTAEQLAAQNIAALHKGPRHTRQ